MIMKKILLSLGLTLGTLFSANATTLVIEINCQTYVCINMIQTNVVNGVNYVFLADVSNLCMFVVDGNGYTYYATDGDANNFQFPFLNTFPFSGYVYEGPGSIPLPLATFPLPVVGFGDDDNRYQFNYMKFQLKGANGNGFGPSGGIYAGTDSDTLSPPGTYYSPAGLEYEASYFFLMGIHYFEFNDLP